MNFFSKRLLIYSVLLIFVIIFIESKKSLVREKRNQQPDSILSIHLQEGVPVKTLKLEKSELVETLRVSLQKCGDKHCFHLPERFAQKVSGSATLFNPNQIDDVWGKVIRKKAYDSITGLYPVEVDLDDHALDYWSEASPYLIASVEGRKLNNVLAIPVTSVLYGDKTPFVWVLNEKGLTEKKDVEMGLRSENKVEVLSGLSAGELLVVQGQGLLHQIQKAHSLNQAEGEP